ncbi:MAG: PLP-dependent aminotransferase family protein [Butyrivibrio sp.]|nr:PLP-dependent aminotransferase family protein [Acetatifactor muris]MCM1559697.1 PLP-dependent aminotransferase family protein [Butyrivibrio sp.]
MYEMTIRLQAGGGRLYEQIYDHIRKEIRDGKLLAGERLPSTRSLAEYLQVARSTVDYAYGQLLDEGYIEARPCKGYFVCPMEELLQLEDVRVNPDAGGIRRTGGTIYTPDGENARGELRREAETAGGKNGEKAAIGNGAESSVSGQGQDSEAAYVPLQAAGSPAWVCDFSPHEIDMSGFPFGVWKRITKNILTDANSDLFSRGEPQGDYELRLTISRYLHSSRGVNCRPEQIVVGAGNDYLLLLLEKLLGKQVRIAMENPTYLRSWRILKSFSYQVVTVDADESGMKAGQLEQENVSAVYCMPSHQFPSGTVMPIGRRLELLKWADKAPDRYIIEDDYDSEFRYHGKPIPALQATDGHGRVIYIGSFSKAIAPAIRISFMVLPEVLLEKYRRELFFYSCTVSRIDQGILNEFIRDGYFERHLNRMRKIYRAKHELLLEELRPFREKFAVTGENAGLHLLLTDREGRSEEQLLRSAGAAGVRVYGLSENMAGPSGEGEKRETKTGPATVLMGFGALKAEQIQEGVRRLKDVWL